MTKYRPNRRLQKTYQGLIAKGFNLFLVEHSKLEEALHWLCERAPIPPEYVATYGEDAERFRPILARAWTSLGYGPGFEVVNHQNDPFAVFGVARGDLAFEFKMRFV